MKHLVFADDTLAQLKSTCFTTFDFCLRGAGERDIETAIVDEVLLLLDATGRVVFIGSVTQVGERPGLPRHARVGAALSSDRWCPGGGRREHHL